MPKVKFADLCKRRYDRGWAIDHIDTDFAICEPTTITEATEEVYENIEKLIADIQVGTHKQMKWFRIRKTYIDKKSGKDFKLNKPKTWKHRLQSCYTSEKHTKDGLVVVVAVDEFAIPTRCELDGYIVGAEEYTTQLKTRVIQKFEASGNKKIKDTCSSGSGKKREDSEGYILYMTYKLE